MFYLATALEISPFPRESGRRACKLGIFQQPVNGVYLGLAEEARSAAGQLIPAAVSG